MLSKPEKRPLTKLSGARFLAETFSGYGITHVFFVEAILRKALVEMEALGIRRVLTHSEKAAAYMADGYARVSFRPGICMSQSVGAANLAAGLQDAYLAASPVIALTGRKEASYQQRHAYQEIQHAPLFQPVTKFNVIIEKEEQLSHLLRQAFREATSMAPGPVHLDVMGHMGQLTDKSEIDVDVTVDDPYTRYPSHRPEPEPEKVASAVRLLQAAKRPVIVAGGGAAKSSAEAAIVKLAEILLIPIATSLNGKGVIPDNHPLGVGVAGAYCRECANEVLAKADLVFFVGSRTGDILTKDWTLPDKKVSVIQVDIDAAELGRNYPNTFGLMGDARKTIEKMIEEADPRQQKAEWSKEVLRIVNGWRHQVKDLCNSDAVPIRPERLCRELSNALPPNAILVTDTGNSSIWTGGWTDLIYPTQHYLRAAGSLGWAFPASLGAKCAAPDRPVVCFTGDGGFWYHLSEMETAVRCGIHTVTIINNNHCFGQCSRGVNNAYGGRPGRREDLYKFNEMNFSELAQTMGCKGIRVERPEDILSSIKLALAADEPVVVEVLTDETA